MRDWLGKPLLIVLAIVLALGAASAVWLRSGPTTAQAAARPAAADPYHQQVNRLMHDIERGNN